MYVHTQLNNLYLYIFIKDIYIKPLYFRGYKFHRSPEICFKEKFLWIIFEDERNNNISYVIYVVTREQNILRINIFKAWKMSAKSSKISRLTVC